MEKIVVEKFSNRIALEMGLAIAELATEKNVQVGVEIRRLNYSVFLFIDENLSADIQNWLRRKANVAKHFERSSLSVRQEFKDAAVLQTTFGLDEKDHALSGGSMPIFLKEGGMIGTVTVSGLKDEDDQQLIIDALKGRFF